MINMQTQTLLLLELEEELNVGPVQMIAILGVDKTTYYKWRRGTRTIPAIGLRCIQLVRAMHRNGMDYPSA